MKSTVFITLLLALISSGFGQDSSSKSRTQAPEVKLVTTHGEILLRLYDETPLHRDNFLKIVRDGVLDSALFHRVIQDFMIQGGDTDSKTAKPGDALGEGDLPYRVPAEIRPELFHKKGVLAAARGDLPERESSSTQFYIVQGKVLNDSLLDRAETRINGWLAEYYVKHEDEYSKKLDSLNVAIAQENSDAILRINSAFAALARDYKGFETYRIPQAHRQVYKTLGGTPHLDQNYTVFGEVVSGLEVVDTIARQKTNKQDRPLVDVRILEAVIVDP
jgi:peptidyl-prolyl cis-trans isomerase B (cyclophilin B)